MQKEIYADNIFYYTSVIENPQHIIDMLEETDALLTDESLISCWHDWTSSNADHQFGYRKVTNEESFASSTDQVRSIYAVLNEALISVGKDYSDTLGIPNGAKAPISISKYLPNEYMGPHADEGHPEAHFSAVLYLNDNFNGGGLGFPNQNVFIQPKAGSIIVFPSVQPYVHDPKPADDVKYISPAFWFTENSPFSSLQV